MAGNRHRGRPRGKKIRQSRARQSMASLLEILESPSDRDPEVISSAARDALSLVRRHKVELPDSVRPWLCRGCHILLRPHRNARVRVRRGFLIVTCLDCGRVRRRPLSD